MPQPEHPEAGSLAWWATTFGVSRQHLSQSWGAWGWWKPNVFRMLCRRRAEWLCGMRWRGGQERLKQELQRLGRMGEWQTLPPKPGRGRPVVPPSEEFLGEVGFALDPIRRKQYRRALGRFWRGLIADAGTRTATLPPAAKQLRKVAKAATALSGGTGARELPPPTPMRLPGGQGRPPLRSVQTYGRFAGYVAVPSREKLWELLEGIDFDRYPLPGKWEELSELELFEYAEKVGRV